MSWAEVKKINSDMLTPLDRLFKNSFYLYASDNTLAAITKYPMERSIKVKYDGACRVKLLLHNGSSTRGDSIEISVKVNGTHKAYITGELVAGASGEAYVDISVNKNDVITIEEVSISSHINVSAFNLCGTIGVGGLGAEAIENNT